MQAREVSSPSPIRWGILSTANISVKSVAPAIVASANGRLTAIGSRDPHRAAQVYSFVPNVRIYPDYNSVIHNPEIDAIYNPLPNSLHAEWSIKAMEAGKHVLCEKPMAITAKEAAKMAEVARANKVLLMEAF